MHDWLDDRLARWIVATCARLVAYHEGRAARYRRIAERARAALAGLEVRPWR